MREKIKELSKDTAIYGISTILGRFLSFILTPFYTHFLPNTGEMGIFNNYYAAVAFLNVIFIYGMDAAFMKYTSVAEEKDKEKIFSTSFNFVVLSSIAFALLLLLLQTQFLYLMDIPAKYLAQDSAKFYRLYYYLIIILVLDTIAIIPFAKLRLERRSKKFSIIRLLNIAINLALNFLFFLKFKMGIESIFLANVIASLFSLLMLAPDFLRDLKPVIDLGYLKKILIFGIPYLPTAISSTVVQVIDRPVVERMTNYDTLGIYSASYKLGTFMMLVVMMFQFAWQPFFLTNAKEKNAKEIFAKVLTLFLLFASLLWLVLSLFVDDLVRMEFFGVSIYNPKYQSGLIIVPIILLGYLFNGLYYNFQPGLYIQEKTKYFPIVTLAGAIVNVVVNILLIPILGLIGAALATLASYMVMATGLYYFAQKVYPIKYEYAKVGKILFLVLLTCGIYYYLHYTIGLLFVYKIIMLFGFVGMLFALRVVDKDEIVKNLKLLLRVK